MRLWLCIFIAAFGHGMTSAALPEGGLYKPTFLLDDRSFAAGTAFLTSVPVGKCEYAVLVSCFHVLGDAPEKIRAAAGLAMSEPRLAIIAPRIVPVKGARSAEDLDMSGELSLFLVRDLPKEATVMRLADTMPKIGETIWLFARIFQTADPKFYRGRVVGVDNTHLMYAMDEPELELGGTSGAPILNAQGEVVGINAGGRIFLGVLHGFANPVSVFRPKMVEALSTLKE